MKIVTKFYLLGLLSISISCSSQTNQETELILKETKKKITSYIDSANHYFDLVIADHNKGIDNSEIERKYSKEIERFETKIDQVLNKPNELGKQGKLTQSEYNKWMNEIDFSSTIEKNKKVKSWGIDFNRLPVTNKYKLEQQYIDSNNGFTMSFPNNWTILDSYQDYTLMGAGPISIDTSSQMERQGGFGLDISVLKQDYSTIEYYQGNLTSIKKAYLDLKIIEEKSINLNGIQAKYIAHQCTVEGKPFTSIQVYFTYNKKGYVLNGTAISEEFERYRDLYIEIARTFKITKK